MLSPFNFTTLSTIPSYLWAFYAVYIVGFLAAIIIFFNYGFKQPKRLALVQAFFSIALVFLTACFYIGSGYLWLIIPFPGVQTLPQIPILAAMTVLMVCLSCVYISRLAVIYSAEFPKFKMLIMPLLIIILAYQAFVVYFTTYTTVFYNFDVLKNYHGSAANYSSTQSTCRTQYMYMKITKSGQLKFMCTFPIYTIELTSIPDYFYSNPQLITDAHAVNPSLWDVTKLKASNS